MSQGSVRGLLKQYGLRPSKGLGQNFLCNQVMLERIVAAAELTGDDVVLEIGPGLGSMTELLAQLAGHVVAVELDERLIPILEGTLSGLDNVTLIQGDILAFTPAELLRTARRESPDSGTSYVVVANLPYYITSAVLRHLLEAKLKPERAVVTVQREVAERLVAEPGDMSLLAVSVQLYGQPEVLFRLRPGNFYPSPGVESAVVRVDVRPTPLVDEADIAVFFRVVRAGFSQRRKQLRNALSAGLRMSADDVVSRLEAVGIDPRRRAQTLSVDEWARVTGALRECVS